MTRILNPRTYGMVANLLEEGKSGYITVHQFDMLFHSMGIQLLLSNGKRQTIRPAYRRGPVAGKATCGLALPVNSIPFLYGSNGSGAILPGDWVDMPVAAKQEKPQRNHKLFEFNKEVE